MKLKLKTSGTEFEYEGSERFLEFKIPDLIEKTQKSYYDLLKMDLMCISRDIEGKIIELHSLEKEIKILVDRLNIVGDDAQLANVDLQNILQKQQQTLALMSNITKMVHDSGMAIIRKISG